MKLKKAILKVESTEKSFAEIFQTLKNRSHKQANKFVISFPDFATLGKVLTGNRLQILSAIRTHKPKSIQHLARILERDFKNVYQDVKFLENFGLIALSHSGSRKPAVPTALFEEIVLAA
jgi:predicted transcriptional regulator